jgi:thiol-disulfide isomerase/thioredoxin
MKYLSFIFFVSVILLSSLSCSKKNNNVLTFQFDKQATLIVKNIKGNKVHSIVGRYISLFPPDFINNYKLTDKIILTKNDAKSINYKISIPTKTLLIIDDNLWLPMFLVPGDTLYVYLDLSDSTKIPEKIDFKGKNASINNYQMKRYIKDNESFEDKCVRIDNSNLDVMKQQAKLDSVALLETNYLNNYCKDNYLSEWYRIYEKNQILYRIAFDKLYKLNERKWRYNLNNPNNNNYYDFLSKTKINNSEALISPNYYYSLWQYFEGSFVDSIANLTVYERGEKLLEAGNIQLTGEVRDVYQAYIIYNFMIDFISPELSSKIINKEKTEVGYNKYTAYLENYLKDRETLKSGTIAPAFYLLSATNEYKSLSNYKGKVILLNFWFPGCKPFIQEIPYENDLVNRFKNKDFYLINICFYASKGDWQQGIKRFKMEGINLFANENWQQKLAKSYRISAYPHYTLIDKEGRIISNNPLRPSTGLSDEIPNYIGN